LEIVSVEGERSLVSKNGKTRVLTHKNFKKTQGEPRGSGIRLEKREPETKKLGKDGKPKGDPGRGKRREIRQLKEKKPTDLQNTKKNEDENSVEPGKTNHRG